MNNRYMKIVLKKELYNAQCSLDGMSDYATKEEALQFVNDNVIEKIENVLKEFGIVEKDKNG